MAPQLGPDDVFSAIADPTRRRILELLAERPEAVGELAARFAISRPAISKHLKVLGEAGLVRAEADGRRNIYALQPDALVEVRAWLDGLWNEKLMLLKRLAEGDA